MVHNRPAERYATDPRNAQLRPTRRLPEELAFCLKILPFERDFLAFGANISGSLGRLDNQGNRSYAYLCRSICNSETPVGPVRGLAHASTRLAAAADSSRPPTRFSTGSSAGRSFAARSR